jgi:modulator of FtsH protease HflK
VNHDHFLRLIRDPDAPTPPSGGPTGTPTSSQRTGRTRPASVNLRAGSAKGDADAMDPANQSLADALRITLRLIQGGMLVLAGLFVVSGSQSVRENERGIRLLFGKIDRSDVQPGLSLSPPYPVGELVRVDVGQAEIKLDTHFWVFAPNKADLTKPIDQLNKSPNLTPGQGGSNLTADGNLAHTQWKVVYTRDNAAKWAQNVLPEVEFDLVRTAAQRGIVQACAKVNLDDLLRQTGGDAGSVAARAKDIAQRQLDRAQSGIRLQQILLENVTPPMWVRDKFNAVQGAVSDATKNEDGAQSYANTVLTQQAGEGIAALRALLDEYEEAVEGRGKRPADTVLTDINTLMAGEPVTLDGTTIPGITSGKIANIIAEARQYRSEVANKRRAEYERYVQKLAQYQSNPALMVSAEVSDAVRAFLARADVQMMLTPAGTDFIELNLNRDPEVMRDIIRRIRQAEGDAAQKERLKLLEEDRFKPKTTETLEQ